MKSENSVSQQLTDLWKMTVALEIQAAEEAQRTHLAFKKEQNGELLEMWSRFRSANYNHKRTKQLMAAFEYGAQHTNSKQQRLKEEERQNHVYVPISSIAWTIQETQFLIKCGKEMDIGLASKEFYADLYRRFQPTHRSLGSVRSKAKRLDIYPCV